MYCFHFILLYYIFCFGANAQKFGILQDIVNENGLSSANINEYTNAGKYSEAREENHDGIFYYRESIFKKLEESMKRIGMLENKLKSYDQDCMRIKLLEEKLLAAEEVTNTHSYRIKILEKRLYKSEHARLIQSKVLNRRLVYDKVFANRLRVAEERLSHMDDFELRLKRDGHYFTGRILESVLPPRTNQSMEYTVILKNDNTTHDSQRSVDVRTNSSNYKRIRKDGKRTSSGFISTVMRGIQRLRIGISAAQNQHGVRVQPGQAIIFDKVLFNDDGGFDMSSGMYRCPVSGLYFFTFTVSSFNGNRIFAYLVLNGLWKIYIYAGVGNDGSGLHDSIGIGNAIFLCRAGDLVWAKMESGEYIGGQTSITGFLIWEDSQSS